MHNFHKTPKGYIKSLISLFILVLEGHLLPKVRLIDDASVWIITWDLPTGAKVEIPCISGDNYGPCIWDCVAPIIDFTVCINELDGVANTLSFIVWPLGGVHRYIHLFFNLFSFSSTLSLPWNWLILRFSWWDLVTNVKRLL